MNARQHFCKLDHQFRVDLTLEQFRLPDLMGFGNRLHSQEIILTILKTEPGNPGLGNSGMEETDCLGFPVYSCRITKPIGFHPEFFQCLLDDPCLAVSKSNHHCSVGDTSGK